MARELGRDCELYLVQFSAMSYTFVECTSKQDLFMYLAKCTKEGHVVTGVNEISKYSNRRPKVAVKTDPEYKKILKSVMTGDE